MECNICGGSVFLNGPGKRLSITGKFPHCKSCSSLERHRAVFSYFNKIIRNHSLKHLSVLHFAKDMSISSSWFKEYEYSIYEKHNSLDLCAIDRKSNSYDLVVGNHVLEHVKDDKSALKELVRIIDSDGLIFLTVPDPIREDKTKDWGFADNKCHGHYRIYGRDCTELFSNYGKVKEILIKDSVTGVEDIAHIIYKRDNATVQMFIDAI